MPDEKAVHDLRVAVKKLRSYLLLLHTVLKKQGEISGFEKTGQLFKVLGKHRDIEMGLILLQDFEKRKKVTYTAFRFHLKVALQRAQRWAQDALSRYDDAELTQLTKQLSQDLKETNRLDLLKKLSSLFTSEEKKLEHLEKHLARQPHELRKMLKNIFYWISICPKDFFLNSSQISKLKKSLDCLGSWQDHEMLRSKIKHFRKDFVPDSREEYEKLKDLEKSIDKKMEELLDKAGENIQFVLKGSPNTTVR